MMVAVDVLSVVHLFIMPQRKGFVLIIQRSWKNKKQNLISGYNLRTGVRQRMVVESLPRLRSGSTKCVGKPRELVTDSLVAIACLSGRQAPRLAMPPNYFYNRYN
jgi:hypothetical protein